MSAPSNTSSVELARELNRYLANNASVRRQASNQIAKMAAANIDADQLLAICEGAQREVDYYGKVAGLADLPGYAESTLSPSTTAAEFTSSLNALAAALAEVVTEVTLTFPPDGYLDEPPIVDGHRNLREYTPAQTANLRADLQAVVDAIDP